MLIDVKQITDICVKLRIDIEEFYFLYLVSIKDHKTMTHYVKNINGFQIDFIDNLQKKGLLLDINNYSKPNDFKEGKKVIKLNTLFTTPTFDEALVEGEAIAGIADAYEELLDVYPYELAGSNGIKYPARTGTTEKNSALYIKHLLRYPDHHEAIIAAIKFGKENSLIKWGLEKFIENKYWGLLVDAMEGNSRQTENGEPLYGNNEF
jgi:hypothetical protein